MSEDITKGKNIMSNLLQLLSFLSGLFLITFFVRERRNSRKCTCAKCCDELPAEKFGSSLNERQEVLLESIKSNGTLTPSEIYSLAPDVSTRTLRRDMDVLVNDGFVVQEGSTKSTKYTYIGRL